MLTELNQPAPAAYWRLVTAPGVFRFDDPSVSEPTP